MLLIGPKADLTVRVILMSASGGERTSAECPLRPGAIIDRSVPSRTRYRYVLMTGVVPRDETTTRTAHVVAKSIRVARFESGRNDLARIY
jgi:hypothetical protein